MRDDLRPRCCDLIVTESCMFRCRMCRMWRSAFTETPADEDWRRFIDSFSRLARPGAQVQFVGGEPLLKPGIFDLVRYASERKLSTTMTTNGYLIDGERAKAISESGLSTLVISIDNLSPTVHDRLRGKPGALARALAAIDAVSSFSPRPAIHVCSIIMKPTLPGIIELAQWASRDCRIGQISFQAVMQPFFTEPDEKWYQDPAFSALWPGDDRRAGFILEELAGMKLAGARITNPAAQFDVFSRYFSRPDRFVRAGSCNLGYSAVSVGARGDIYLCQSLPPLGNIRDKISLDDLWESEKAAVARQRIDNCRANCKSLINCFFEEE